MRIRYAQNKNQIIMKKYEVIISSLVNPCEDLWTDKEPETKEYAYIVLASNMLEAKLIAFSEHDLSVWESKVYEIID